MIFTVLCWVSNAAKQFSDVVVFQLSLSVTIQMKAAQQYFLLMLFIIPHKVKF